MRIAKITDSLNTLKSTGIPIVGIIDVGIQHSTPPLMNVFPNLHHYLFEPIEEYYSHIRANYSALSYDLIEAAVSDFDGSLLLHTEKKTRGDEVSHSYIVSAPTSSSRTVQSIKLDTHFQSKLTGPYLLKIDVEGPSVPASILKGATNLLTKVSVVVIEVTVDTFMERAILLHEAGFDVWDICDLCYYNECLWQADLVLVRRDFKASNPKLRPMHIKPFSSALWQSGF